MAQDLKTATEPMKNSAARAASIRETFAGIYNTEAEIAEAREKHLKPLTDLRTKQWRNLKKDLNIPRKILEGQYRLFKAARQSQEAEEENDTIDQMREIHLALHPGGELDWVAALDQITGD